MRNRIYLSLAQMGGREQDFIREAFDTNWVVPLGPNVDAFESELADFIGQNRHVVALSAGTAAIHLGLVQLGVGRDDEVICQSFTFSASANPIAYQGARPVFVDSEPDTWNLSPALLEEAILDRKAKTGRYPKAIIPVHLYGMPAKMDEIAAVAARYGIPLMEDAAEAIGSEYRGRKCGTFGEFGALSFNGNKMITTSGGGALVCRTAEEAQRTKFFATQARENRPYYYHEHIGYNYRLSNVSAGIGRGQMLVLDAHIAAARDPRPLHAAARRPARHRGQTKPRARLRLEFLAHLHHGRSSPFREHGRRNPRPSGARKHRIPPAVASDAHAARFRRLPRLHRRHLGGDFRPGALPPLRLGPHGRRHRRGDGRNPQTAQTLNPPI